jgi:hypothetical protein
MTTVSLLTAASRLQNKPSAAESGGVGPPMPRAECKLDFHCENFGELD